MLKKDLNIHSFPSLKSMMRSAIIMTTRLRLSKSSLKITRPKLALIYVKNWVKKVTSALPGSSREPAGAQTAA